jgi:hypothetical protein
MMAKEVSIQQKVIKVILGRPIAGKTLPLIQAMVM